MRKRILSLLAIFVPIAVFCSLEFGDTERGPANSVLLPLLPAQAHAFGCVLHTKCQGSGPGTTCISFQWTSCNQVSATDCVDC